MGKGNNIETTGYLSQQVLIAMPGMVDSNFAGSVTLLCQHNEEGAIGITINRLADYSLAEVFSQLQLECNDEAIRNMPVLEGGPVAPDRGFVLHTPCDGYQSSLPINDEIMITIFGCPRNDDLIDLIISDEDFDIFLDIHLDERRTTQGGFVVTSDIVDTLLIFRHPAHIIFQSGVALGFGGFEANQFFQELTVVPILVITFLDRTAELFVKLQIVLILFGQILERFQDFLY